jgi:hypothetical protein
MFLRSPPFRFSLLLLAPETSLKGLLSHLSVALLRHQVFHDGPIAQSIEILETRPLLATRSNGIEQAFTIGGQRTRCAPPRDRNPFMSALNICFGLLIALFAILLFYRQRRQKTHIATFGSQRMCPACGLITSRLKTCCLECGKFLPAIV